MGVLCWVANPGQQAHFNDPGRISAVIEEILRAPYSSGAGGLCRYARTDLPIGEVTVRAGELVLLATRAANHDPAVYADPDLFDITRQGPAHLAFGHGAHYCLGAPLARIELEAVFSQLPARFPQLRLRVPVGQLRLRRDTLTGGLIELPVEW
jgi:pentalenolactone synthase